MNAGWRGGRGVSSLREKIEKIALGAFDWYFDNESWSRLFVFERSFCLQVWHFIKIKTKKKGPLQFFSVTLLPKSEMENNKFPTISQCKKNPQQLSTKLLRWSAFVTVETSYQCIYSVCSLNVYTVKMAGVALMNAYRKYVFQDILFPALRVHVHYSLSLSDLYRSVVPEETSTWIHLYDLYFSERHRTTYSHVHKHRTWLRVLYRACHIVAFSVGQPLKWFASPV